MDCYPTFGNVSITGPLLVQNKTFSAQFEHVTKFTIKSKSNQTMPSSSVESKIVFQEKKKQHLLA